jgi:NADPH:quinone reductase-like Zn-dependent oxidoreductase
VTAASINPADVRLLSGDFHDVAPLTFPHTPGNDFAGTVTEVGAGVTAYREGSEIFGLALPRALRAMAGARPSLGTGALAEYVVVEADTPMLAPRPPGLPVEQAAALPTAGLTTRALLGTAGFRPGETVLVIGATGGVGTTLLPPLAATGAEIVATATEADAGLVRSLGAARTVGYAAEDRPHGVDTVVNLALPGERLAEAAEAVRPGGRLFTITPPPPDSAWTFVLDLDGAFGGMAAVAGLSATIGRRYRLADGPRACVDFERRHTTGKLVVTV